MTHTFVHTPTVLTTAGSPSAAVLEELPGLGAIP